VPLAIKSITVAIGMPPGTAANGPKLVCWAKPQHAYLLTILLQWDIARDHNRAFFHQPFDNKTSFNNIFTLPMTEPAASNVYDLAQLRDRQNVFRDRIHAGQVLAKMLESSGHKNRIVLGIPAGGVPVGTVVATCLNQTFDVAVVSKITLPWNTEVGYGAIAFDGTQKLNKSMLSRFDLSQAQIQKGIEKTAAKVSHRVAKLRGEKPFPELSQRKVIVVDDGLASGFTMRVALAALRKSGAEHIIVAVPTGHEQTVAQLAEMVETLYCPNIRGGWHFAVADAYEKWSDVTEAEVLKLLKF
jgi:predicted phosphoribosyltransferase